MKIGQISTAQSFGAFNVMSKDADEVSGYLAKMYDTPALKAKARDVFSHLDAVSTGHKQDYTLKYDDFAKNNDNYCGTNDHIAFDYLDPEYRSARTYGLDVVPRESGGEPKTEEEKLTLLENFQKGVLSIINRRAEHSAQQKSYKEIDFFKRSA